MLSHHRVSIVLPSVGTDIPVAMPFELAESFRHSHLVVQPSDLALNPPESYLFIQDGLIIACGAVYSLCYVFYIAKTYRDKVFCGPLEYM